MLTRFSVARCCCAPVVVPTRDVRGIWQVAGTLRVSGTMYIGFDEWFNFNGRVSGYCLYSNVQVAQGATIASASLDMTDVRDFVTPRCPPGTGGTPLARDQVQCLYGQSVGFTIVGHDVDNATELANAAAYNAAPRTTANVPQTYNTAPNAGGQPSWPINSTQVVADITAIVQEIVNRPSWAPGNAIQLLFDENGSFNTPGVAGALMPILDTALSLQPVLTITV